MRNIWCQVFLENWYPPPAPTPPAVPWCPSPGAGSLAGLLGGAVGTFQPQADRLVFGWAENNTASKMAVSLDMTGFQAYFSVKE